MTKWIVGGAAALGALLFFQNRAQAQGGAGGVGGAGGAGGAGAAGPPGAAGQGSGGGTTGGSGVLQAYEFADMTVNNIVVDPNALKQGDQVLVELQKPGVSHGDAFGATINGTPNADGTIEVIVTGPVTAGDIPAQFPLGSTVEAPLTSLQPGSAQDAGAFSSS